MGGDKGAILTFAKVRISSTMTIDAEGVYGVKCLPHFSMGMVAIVVAGKPVNLAAVKAAVAKIPSPKPKKRFEDLLAQIPATN